MHITYIHHSCFCVEFEDLILLFDYYKGTLPKLDPNKQIIIFSSHKHHDHFDMNIFDFAKEHPNITYILSKDIKMSKSYLERNNISLETIDRIHYINKNEEISCLVNTDNNSSETITIKTLESTDAGVAFLIHYHDKVIYHAGDLNWWSWPGETEDEYIDMTNRFVSIIKNLEGTKIDVAFIPLDPRQEDRFWWGFDAFMKTTNTKHAFPMHFWMDYTVIKRLKNMEEAKDYKDRVFDIYEEGQQFDLILE